MKHYNFLFIVALLLVSCGGNTTVSTGPFVNAGPVNISATVDQNGVIKLNGSYQQTLVGNEILGAGWQIGFETTLNDAKQKSNTLYVLYEDSQGNVRRLEYDINQPFEITFSKEQWVREIRHEGDGNIIVAVEHKVTSSGSSSNNSSGAASSCPGAKPQHVFVGATIHVCTLSDNLIVKTQPSSSGSEIFRIAPGTIAFVIDGPSCSENSSWWRIEVSAGTTVRQGSYDAPQFSLDTDMFGWVREGSDEIDPYFICVSR